MTYSHVGLLDAICFLVRISQVFFNQVGLLEVICSLLEVFKVISSLGF